jgi:hypothetical protein
MDAEREPACDGVTVTATLQSTLESAFLVQAGEP